MSNKRRPAGRISPQRAELIDRLHLAGRELSTATVMFHTAVAARRGLSATEEKAIDVLLRGGPMTHAELGRHTGLAPASVSNLIDRLERKGYASRAPHPEDGRRVLVTAAAERLLGEFVPLYADWVGSLNELFATYTDSELETICDFMTQAARRQRDAAERLTQSPDAGSAPAPPQQS